MRFIPLGVGDAFSAAWYSSSILLLYRDFRLLIDCPHPLRKILREGSTQCGISMDVDTLDAVVLTHLHADHCAGVEGLGFYYLHCLKRRIELAAHPIVMRDLWPNHLEGVMAPLCDPPAERRKFESYFIPRLLNDTGPTDLGPIEIRCRRTHHHVPTTAFLLSAGGKTLGYSADTSFDPDLITWLSAADVIIHESNKGTHTPYEKLAALPLELQQKMRLIHLPDDFDRRNSAIEVLEQGRVYPV